MDKQEFLSYAQQGFNRVPVYCEITADFDTPLSTYLKLAEGPYSYLFESVQGGEKWGRYSIIGLPCTNLLKVEGSSVSVIEQGKVVESFEREDPIEFVEEFRERFQVPELEALPRFHGGLVGYFGYDTVRFIEKRLKDSVPEDDLNTPDILLMVSDELVVFDNLKGKLQLIVHADPNQDGSYEAAQARLAELTDKLRKALPTRIRNRLSAENAPGTDIEESDFKPRFEQDDFMASVDKIKEYILAGDVMQTVIAQRMSIPFEAEPMNLYRALRCLNPSPYMYFLNMGDFHIVGSSPEILARVDHGEVTVRPIAGTRRRGHNEQEDLALEEELLADPKEIAEHLMLIDLGRNDAGRIAEIGSVKVTDQMVVERYSHVMHIVSNVTGQLKEGMSSMDVLRATLPAGTLSGAPKIRAMEIIDELEPVKRGIYGGAVGYVSWQDNMDTAIAIRTAVIKDKTLYIQAGAGVVADSVPRLEWKETMNKGRAVFKAVEMATKGLV